MGRRTLAVAAALVFVLLYSCAGDGLKSITPDTNKPAAPIALPPFPAGGPDAETLSAPRVAAFTDYIELGSEFWDRSTTGAQTNGDKLDLTSTPADVAWGMWRWTGFIADMRPQEIELTVTPGTGGTFWLLLADYTDRHWEIHGPLDGSVSTFTYDPTKDYVSNGGNSVYAVLLVEGANTLQAGQLRISATDLPAPTNLTASNVISNQAQLSWDPITNPAALGYQLYTGPVADFNIGDPGVEQRGGMITNPTYLVTGLTGSTQYFWRVRAYFGAWGPLSATAEFTTTESQPAVPVITAETYLQQNVQAIFGPFDTTDEDTPLNQLVFKWDFENDGTTDEQTTGPAYVYHTYTSRGPYTVKLTVFDGQNASVTKDVFVGFKYRVEAVTTPQGLAVGANTCDADPETGRIVLLYNQTVRYCNGFGWSTIDLSPLGEPDCQDVALNSGGFSLLTGAGGSPPSWKIYDYSVGGFNQNGSASAAGNIFYAARLDIAPNGRRSVMLVGGDQAGMSFTGKLYLWHEKADSTYATNNVTLDTNKWQAYDLVRSDTDSYFFYTKATTMHVWSFSDSANSDASIQNYSGDATSVALSLDAENPTHVFWSTSHTGAVFFGDNYGSANGANQKYTTSATNLKAIATGLIGDNQGHFFFTGTDATEMQHLYGYDTVAGGGTLYDIVSGAGAASGGTGAFYPGASDTGVYTLVKEPRDGEVTARIIENGVVQSEYQAFAPSGVDTITDTASVLAFSDNSFLCLAQQAFPTALSASASGPDASFLPGLLGVNTWCNPNCAAVDPLGGGIFVGSYTDGGRLLLNRFPTGDTTGTVTANLTGTTNARLVVNRDFTDLRLFYLANSDKRIEARSWDGASWSAPVTVYNGGSTIEAYSAAVTADNSEWGIAFIDAGDKVNLVETSGGTWGGAQELSSEPVLGLCGIGFDYCLSDPSQGLMVAVARENAPVGVYAGTLPQGGSISWEQINDAPLNEIQSLNLFWHLANPVVVFHHPSAPATNDRFWIYERLPSGWFFTEPNIELHSSPLAKAVLPAGHIVFTGYELSTLPRQMVVAEFYP